MTDYIYKGQKRHQQLTAKAFARTYDELQEDLKYLDGSPGSPVMDGMPHGSGTGDRTASVAMKRYGISRSIDIIEEAARAVAEPGMYPYLLEAVTHGTTFKELQAKRIPCSINTFTSYKKKYYDTLWNLLQTR